MALYKDSKSRIHHVHVFSAVNNKNLLILKLWVKHNFFIMSALHLSVNASETIKDISSYCNIISKANSRARLLHEYKRTEQAPMQNQIIILAVAICFFPTLNKILNGVAVEIAFILKCIAFKRDENLSGRVGAKSGDSAKLLNKFLLCQIVDLQNKVMVSNNLCYLTYKFRKF